MSNDSGWTLIANLTGSGTAYAHFGYSASLSSDGSTLAVGEYGTNSVWVYAAMPIGSGTWTVQRKLAHTEVGFAGYVAFGAAVALSASGDTLVVGADYDSSYKGAAVVFSRNSTDGWSVESPIFANGSAISFFGYAVAINGAGNRIAVGAPWDSLQGPQNGAVYIYSRNETTLSWSYRQRVLPSDSISATGRQFGQSLSLSSSGDTLVVGAFGEDSWTGAWWHFEWNGTLFEQSGLKKVGQPTSNNAQQGWSIALSADGQTVLGACTTVSAMQHLARGDCVLIAFSVRCLRVWLV
jgi:hypothetical protein